MSGALIELWSPWRSRHNILAGMYVHHVERAHGVGFQLRALLKVGRGVWNRLSAPANGHKNLQ